MCRKTYSIARDLAVEDIESTLLSPVSWSRRCLHGSTSDDVNKELIRLKRAHSERKLTASDIESMRRLIRCCVRLLSDLPEQAVELVELCFSFPDVVSRALMWRLVIFTLQKDATEMIVTERIRRRIGLRLEVEESVFDTLVDSFLKSLEIAISTTDLELDARTMLADET